jgi:hypothetical protein
MAHVEILDNNYPNSGLILLIVPGYWPVGRRKVLTNGDQRSRLHGGGSGIGMNNWQGKNAKQETERSEFLDSIPRFSFL